MEPGTIFGPYRLLELVGVGGMGQVWKALDLRLERVVALKVLKEKDEVLRKALIAEAKTACQLNHPNIAVIFDAGEVEGLPYIAMEFVEGGTLQQQIGRPWDESDLRRLAVQAAEALDHAHQKAIVHRDIKPANLVVTSEGRLEILDFGVAKRTLPSGRGDSNVTLLEETRPGISMGTPAYMSPEQVRGESLGPPSDQFSLGVVLRELATGDHPFRRDGVVETLHAILKDEIEPLMTLRPDLSPDLCSALDRMLEKNPAHRFPSLKAFASLVGGSQGTGPIVLPDAVTQARKHFNPLQDSSGKPPKRIPVALSAAAALVILLIAGFFWWRSQDRPAPGGVRKVVAVLPLESIGVPPDQSWLGTSLVDAMSTGLLRRGDLMVLDRLWVADVMTRLGEVPGQPPRDFQKLLKALKSDLLVLGSYQLAGDQLRVTVRLMDGARGEIKDQFATTGTTAGLLTLEDQLQERLPGMLGLRPPQEMPSDHARAKNPRTRELYARASDLVAQSNADAFAVARDLFREAADQEPDYAPAHAGLARALAGIAAPEAHLGKDENAAAHLIESEAEAREAIRLDPKHSFAHRVLAHSLNIQGRYQEARDAASYAVSLDPADYQAFTVLGDAFANETGAGAHAIAKKHFLRALELAPDYGFAHYRLAVMLQNDGDLEGSVREANITAKLLPSSEYSYLTAGVSLLWLGRVDEARARLEAGIQQAPGFKLLKVTNALAAHDQGDQAAFKHLATLLKGAWPDGHSITVLMEGLEKDMAGDHSGARAIYMGYLHRLKNPESPPPAKDWRRLSVNLYHMARILARNGDKAAALELLNEADRLHPGKKIVATKDPAFH